MLYKLLHTILAFGSRLASSFQTLYFTLQISRLHEFNTEEVALAYTSAQRKTQQLNTATAYQPQYMQSLI